MSDSILRPRRYPLVWNMPFKLLDNGHLRDLETWVDLFRDHTLYDAVGYCASLFLAPAYLLQKLVGSSEFRGAPPVVV